MLVHLVANPVAGGGAAAALIDRAESILSRVGTVKVHAPASRADAQSVLDGLVAEGADRIVALGGDGMVHQAVNACAGTSTVLGVVPAGTGNDTAKGLELPASLEAACAVAMADPAPVDVIDAGDRCAMTVAIVGLAVAINERAERMRFPKGGAKYTVATLAELPRLTAHQLTVTIDGEVHKLDANLLAVANLPYFGGGMRVAPDAKPDDGLLELVAMGPAGAATFATLLPTVFSGRHVRSRHVRVFRGSEIRIEGEALRMRADGEAWGELPATLRARRGAVRIAGAG